MITRNVLNKDGQIIGEMSFPDGTSEDYITKKLAEYSNPPSLPLPNATPRQIRQALILNGIPLSSIDTAISSLPSPYKELAQVEWEYSVAFIRTNNLVNMIGAVLGKTHEEIDELWKFALSL